MARINWKAIAFWGFVVLLVALIVTSFLYSWGSGGWTPMGPVMMGRWGFGPMGWIGMLLMLLIPIGLLFLVVAGAVWLMRAPGSEGESSSAPHPPTETSLSPREILKLRYAQGEITREQYLQMMDDLN